MDNMSLSDIAAVTKDKDNWADGGIWILILLFALGGGLWNRGGAQQDAVTEAGLCSAMNFNNLENLVGRLADQNNKPDRHHRQWHQRSRVCAARSEQ